MEYVPAENGKRLQRRISRAVILITAMTDILYEEERLALE